MARTTYIGGNWKMNLDRAGATELARALVERLGQVDDVDVAVAPPMVYLDAVGRVLAGSRIALAAQNAWDEPNGAFTGETSTEMLRDLGCTAVILGHSERRHQVGETDERINRKILKALEDGLDVIFCIGELLEERQAQQTTEVVRRQVQVGLEGVGATCADGRGLAERLTIAYEPVWAIGTGVTATPDQAQEVHAMVRGLIGDLYDAQTAAAIRIQYGGSVKPANAAELLAQADIDGALVGGASLKPDDFAAIVEAGR